MNHEKDSATERVRRAARTPPKRRFYKEVTVEEGGEGFRPLLDAKPVRTPAKALLSVPSRALAEAIAEEWRAQGPHIDPASMPLTRLANTIVDRIVPARDGIVESLVAYAGADLVCYRAEAPEGLAARQSEAWDPVLDWAAEECGIRLTRIVGVMPRAQDNESLNVFRQAIQNEGDFVLGALADMTHLTGSALLALAVLRGRLSAEQAWAAAHVDEDWQISQWGEDAEASARRAARFRDMLAAARMAAILNEVR